jgi:hypothetical protein
MFAADAYTAQPAVAAPDFNVVQQERTKEGGMRNATYVGDQEGVVTLEASPQLMRRGMPVAMEKLSSKDATDFARQVAHKLGLQNPQPALNDAPYAVDKEGNVLVGVGQIYAYRVEIRLNATGLR